MPEPIKRKPDPIIRQTAEVIELFAPKDRLPGRLSRAHYDVLTSDAAGMSYADIAQLVGCPLGTVKSRINRARITLDRLVMESDTPPLTVAAVTGPIAVGDRVTGAGYPDGGTIIDTQVPTTEPHDA